MGCSTLNARFRLRSPSQSLDIDSFQDAGRCRSDIRHLRDKISAATVATGLTREHKSSAVWLIERNVSGNLNPASSVDTVFSLLSSSSSLNPRRDTVSPIDRNPQTKHDKLHTNSVSTFLAFEDGLSPAMLNALGNSILPASIMSDQLMLSISALDSHWSTLNDPNTVACGFVDHLEFQDGGDA